MNLFLRVTPQGNCNAVFGIVDMDFFKIKNRESSVKTEELKTEVLRKISAVLFVLIQSLIFYLLRK